MYPDDLLEQFVISDLGVPIRAPRWVRPESGSRNRFVPRPQQVAGRSNTTETVMLVELALRQPVNTELAPYALYLFDHPDLLPRVTRCRRIRIHHNWHLPPTRPEASFTLTSLSNQLSAIHVFPMANVQNSHHSLLIADFINDAIVSNANSPSFPADQPPATGWPGIIRQGLDCILYAFIRLTGQSGQFPLSPSKNQNRIRHLRVSSISRTACEKGIVASADAFAAS